MTQLKNQTKNKIEEKKTLPLQFFVGQRHTVRIIFLNELPNSVAIGFHVRTPINGGNIKVKSTPILRCHLVENILPIVGLKPPSPLVEEAIRGYRSMCFIVQFNLCTNANVQFMIHNWGKRHCHPPRTVVCPSVESKDPSHKLVCNGRILCAHYAALDCYPK